MIGTLALPYIGTTVIVPGLLASVSHPNQLFVLTGWLATILDSLSMELKKKSESGHPYQMSNVGSSSTYISKCSCPSPTTCSNDRTVQQHPSIQALRISIYRVMPSDTLPAKKVAIAMAAAVVVFLYLSIK